MAYIGKVAVLVWTGRPLAQGLAGLAVPLLGHSGLGHAGQPAEPGAQAGQAGSSRSCEPAG